MAVFLSPIGGAGWQFFNNDGTVLAGGKIYTYAAGTSTPVAAYTTSAGSVAHTNPIILNSAGRVSSGEVWLTQNVVYKFLLKDSSDVLIGTYDNISGISDVTLPISSSSVTYQPAGTGAVATTVQAKLRQTVSLNDFGFSTTNTAAQNKIAFQTAIASLTRPTTLIIPNGEFLLGADIDTGSYVLGIKGQGKYSTTLMVSGGTKAFFNTASPMEYCQFSNFGVFSTGVSYGIYAATMNHTLIENCLFTGFTVNAIYIGGYSNDIVGNDIFSNSGSGIYLTGTLNNINVLNNKIYANTGIGISVASTDTDAGLSINIKNNAIEANAVAGIIALNTKSLNIKDNYFERNGTTGYTYNDPVTITIKADIHLLANNTFSIYKTEIYSNKCPTVSGNSFTPIGVYSALPNQDGIIFTSYANNLRVENNQVFDTTKINALVCLYQNNLYSTVNTQLVISGNSTNAVNFIGAYTTASQAFNAAHLISVQSSAFRNNYADQNVLSWTASSGTTGSIVHTTNSLDGNYSWSISDGDKVWGKTIDLTTRQELRGNWVWFGAWVNDQGANANARFIIDGVANYGTSPVGGLATWSFQSVVKYIDPAATTLVYEIQKIGTGAGLLINDPFVAIIGNSFPSFQTSNPDFYASSAPTTGSWTLGDFVINSVPTVGQPKSWVCTATGTPGTWVSTGNL